MNLKLASPNALGNKLASLTVLGGLIQVGSTVGVNLHEEEPT